MPDATDPDTQRPSALVIAIDGPAASGKSSVARALAARHGFAYINSGSMYRAVTWSVLKAGIDPADETAVNAHLDAAPIAYTTRDGVAHFTIGGHDPGDELKSAAVNGQVSTIASHRLIRERLVTQQREFGQAGRIVMEGRDIGTVVFPDAKFKFFITASPEERARRRLAQPGETVDGATLAKVAADIAARDKMDSERKVSPLKPANDAILLDTTTMSIEQVVAKVKDLILT